jgi:hypothetical protein
VEIEPRPIRCKAGQIITRIHQRLINLAIDSLQDDEYIGMPYLESDDEDQESINVITYFEVQNGGIFEYMHDINIVAFQDGVIRIKKQTGQIVPLRNTVCGLIDLEATVPQLESWPVGCIRQWHFRSN